MGRSESKSTYIALFPPYHQHLAFDVSFSHPCNSIGGIEDERKLGEIQAYPVVIPCSDVKVAQFP